MLAKKPEQYTVVKLKHSAERQRIKHSLKHQDFWMVLSPFKTCVGNLDQTPLLLSTILTTVPLYKYYSNK